mgnify:CR=1 FL=1
MTVHNADVAAIFEEFADLLEIEGANPFRVRAYRFAARTLRDLSVEAATMVAQGEDLTNLPGIGQDLAGKITEILATGTLAALEAQRKKVPATLTELLRIPGIGTVIAFGSGDYAMRIWLDPNKLAARNLSSADVVKALREQNAQVAAGVVGAPPLPGRTDFQLAVNTQGRLTSEAEFADVIVSADTADGSLVRIKDIGRVELGPNTYALGSYLNDKEAAAIGIFQGPNSNALALSNAVRATMEELKKDFPPGVDYQIVYDPTRFVRTSIEKVVSTLFEAIALVVLVVVVFLQTWRASVIPLLAVPVSVVGTFAVLLALGFSINTLTLFGLVLSIGIVVDDAIVVVENVERNIEAGLNPRDAAVHAMQEVSGPIIAIGLVLFGLVVLLERLVMPWHASVSGGNR